LSPTDAKSCRSSVIHGYLRRADHRLLFGYPRRRQACPPHRPAQSFLTSRFGAIAIVLASPFAADHEILWLLGVRSASSPGYFSGVGASSRTLSTRLRGSARAFVTIFGRGIGARFPFLVGWLSRPRRRLANWAIAGIFAVAPLPLFLAALARAGNPRQFCPADRERGDDLRACPIPLPLWGRSCPRP